MIINKKDKVILESLSAKYGKEKLEKIVEAFGSSKLRNINKSHTEYNNLVRKNAGKHRNERIAALNKYAYQGDEESRSKIGTYIPYFLRDEKTGNVDRREYDYLANTIQNDMNNEVRKKSVDNVIEILNKWGRGTYAWDKITDDDIKIFGSDEIKKTRKYTKDPNYFVIYLDAKNTIVATSEGYGIQYSRSHYGRRHLRDVKFIDIVNDADILQAYVINVSNADTRDIKRHRAENKRGMIENTAEQNREIAQKNIERYKKIINSNKISKFDKIDTDVKESLKICISKLADLNNIDGTDYTSVSNVQSDVQDLTKMMNTLLNNYKYFAYYRNNIKERKGNNAFNVSSFNSYVRSTKDIINEINKYFA